MELICHASQIKGTVQKEVDTSRKGAKCQDGLLSSMGNEMC